MTVSLKYTNITNLGIVVWNRHENHFLSPFFLDLCHLRYNQGSRSPVVSNKKLVMKIRTQAIATSGGRVYTKLLSSYLVLRLNSLLISYSKVRERLKHRQTVTHKDIVEP